MRSSMRAAAALAGGVLLGLAAVAAADTAIQHAPVRVSVKGHPLTIRCKLAAGAETVRAVSLLYAVSRDAAPLRIAMRSSGLGIYAGVIPGHLLADLDRVYYYIEAVDRDGVTRETDWNEVALKSPQDPGAAAIIESMGPAPKEGSGWKTAAWVGGGLLAAGAVYWIAADDDGDSSGGGGTATPGTYTGSSTVGFALSGQAATYESHAATIVIGSDGTVSSQNLHPGVPLSARLSGSSFVFAVPVDDNGATGEIQYVGTVVDNRIVGNIQGSMQTADGKTGTYSGTFSAVRKQ